MSQQKPSQPKNSAQISKALLEHQQEKAAAEFAKLRKAQNDRNRTERLDSRRKLSLPRLITTPEPAKAPKSSKSSLNIRTPSPSPSDSARFEINVTPTFDVKFDDKNNESRHITDEPVEISIKTREKDIRDKETIQPIKIVIDQPDSDSDADKINEENEPNADGKDDDIDDDSDNKDHALLRHDKDGFRIGEDLKEETLDSAADKDEDDAENENDSNSDQNEDNSDKIDDWLEDDRIERNEHNDSSASLRNASVSSSSDSEEETAPDEQLDQVSDTEEEEVNEPAANQGQNFALLLYINSEDSDEEMAKTECPKFRPSMEEVYNPRSDNIAFLFQQSFFIYWAIISI